MLPAPTKSFPIYQELYLYYESDGMNSFFLKKRKHLF